MSGDDKMDHNDPLTDDLDASEEFFEDDGAFGEQGFEEQGEGEETSEDWESYDGEFTTDEGEDAVAPKLKKRAPVKLIAIIGALAIGLGILVMTVAGNKPATRPVHESNTGALPGITASMPKAGTHKSAAAPKAAGLLNDPEALRNLAGTIDKANAAGNPVSPPEGNTGAPVAGVQAAGVPVPVTAPPPPLPVAAASVPASSSGPSSPSSPAEAPSATAPAGVAAPPPEAPAVTEALTPMPAALLPAGAAPAAPAPAEGGLMTAPMPESAPAAAVAEGTANPAPVPPPSSPVAPSSEKEAPQGADAGFTVAPIMPMKASQPDESQARAQGKVQAEATQASDAALKARLDQLIDRVSALETKVSDIQTPPADLQAMQRSLTQISDRLDQLEAQPASTRASAQPGAAVPHKASHAATHHASTSHATSHSASRPTSRATTTRHHVEKTAARWILKSAQPGQAYVSRPGQADMISVHVGDTLPGVGRVTSIGVTSGRWAIQGTQGSVRQ